MVVGETCLNMSFLRLRSSAIVYCPPATDWFLLLEKNTEIVCIVYCYTVISVVNSIRNTSGLNYLTFMDEPKSNSPSM